MRRCVFLAVLVIGTEGLLSPCGAAIAFSTSGVRPTEDLLASSYHSSSNNLNWWGWCQSPYWPYDTANWGLGQTFWLPEMLDGHGNPLDAEIAKITVRAGWDWFGSGAPLAPYTLDIYKFSDTDSRDCVPDYLISSQTDLLPTAGAMVLSGVGHWTTYWTWDLEDIMVESGHRYGFVFSFNNGPVDGQYMTFSRSWTDISGDGVILEPKNGLWNWYSARDLDYAVQGRYVPEPATLGLVFAGLMGVVRWRRARQRNA